MDQIVISGTGCVTCTGLTPHDLYRAAKSHTHGLKLDKETGLTLGFVSAEADAMLQKRIAAHSFAGRLFPNGFPSGARAKPLSYLYGSLVAAMDQAGWTNWPARTGIIFATTTGYVPYWEDDLVSYSTNSLEEKAFANSFRDHPLSRPLEPLLALSAKEKTAVPVRILTSACAAGTQGLALAYQWLASGRVDRCVVAGTELLSTLTIRGFHSLNLISAKPATPFDQDRDGINLSEAAGVVLLERQSTAANTCAFLSGGGMSLDCFDMTSPDPTGNGIARAASEAMRHADLDPGQIDWIHTHGTGSRVNDLAEAAAAVRLFGKTTPPVSSTKGIHGHGLAASGLIETSLCVEAMHDRTILGTEGIKTVDEAIEATILKDHLEKEVGHILKTTLGFGGVNAAVVLSHPKSGGGAHHG